MYALCSVGREEDFVKLSAEEAVKMYTAGDKVATREMFADSLSRCVKARVSQDRAFSEALMGTGNTFLLNVASKGTGNEVFDAMGKRDPQVFKGDNLYGHSLMEMRDIMMTETRKTSLNIAGYSLSHWVDMSKLTILNRDWATVVSNYNELVASDLSASRAQAKNEVAITTEEVAR